MVNDKPALDLCVVMTRQRDPNPWESWCFSVDAVHQADEAEASAAADQAGLVGLGDRTPAGTGSSARTRVLADDGVTTRFVHSGLRLVLHRDEAEGYHLNLSSGAPVWFVMWRIDESDASLARPEFVTLSYHEAGRLLDAQERVDNVPLPDEVAAWLQDYVHLHYRPEPKKRKRPASFLEPGRR
jgi:hypothetical protein